MMTFLPEPARGADCDDGRVVIVTAPKDGTRTMSAFITIRGFLCDDFPLIRIRNETTNLEVIAETSKVCDKFECAFQFAAPVGELVFGNNHITAEIPGEDFVELEVIRTALVGL